MYLNLDVVSFARTWGQTANFFTNINGPIKPILEHNDYCEDNVLNLKLHSRNMLFVICLDLLRFYCNQKKGSDMFILEQCFLFQN